MELEQVFERFSRMLTERLSAGVPTTEDSIRYTFYLALSSAARLNHTDIVLEYPHPSITGAKVDTVVRPADGRNTAAFEFKYDRRNPGGRSQNKTQRAAALLVDVFRLVRIPPTLAGQKHLVYVTDPEMTIYFTNPKNGLREFFELGRGESLRLGADTFAGFSTTFLAGVESLVCDCAVRGSFQADLPEEHHLRVLEVRST